MASRPGTSRAAATSRRENGTVGIRNHTVILPVDDLSNAAAEAVAKVVPGTLALPHAYRRLQFGPDLDLTFRTLIGTGANPNVNSVVVIGIEPNWTDRVVDGIAKTGKMVTGFSIERNGDLKTVERAARVARATCGTTPRSSASPWHATRSCCRSSAASRTPPVGLGSRPTQGNVRGGLTTIEEKAMGNIAKTGTKPVVAALEAAEPPGSGPGLYFMDTSSLLLFPVLSKHLGTGVFFVVALAPALGLLALLLIRWEPIGADLDRVARCRRTWTRRPRSRSATGRCASWRTGRTA